MDIYEDRDKARKGNSFACSHRAAISVTAAVSVCVSTDHALATSVADGRKPQLRNQRIWLGW